MKVEWRGEARVQRHAFFFEKRKKKKSLVVVVVVVVAVEMVSKWGGHFMDDGVLGTSFLHPYPVFLSLLLLLLKTRRIKISGHK